MVSGFRFFQMIRQCHGNTVTQSINWNFVVLLKHNASVSFVFEVVWEKASESFDQIGLAVKKHGVLRFCGFIPAYPDSAAAFSLRREVSGLAPF